MASSEIKSMKREEDYVDLSIFTAPGAWISLITLIFLELILGVDNLVFIAITTDRLPEEKQHIGRRLGLAGALIMRVIFLSFASVLVHMVTPLFTIDLGSLNHGVSIRDIVLFAGGAYLIYKGISELLAVVRLTELKAEYDVKKEKMLHQLGLGQAIATIMVMDLVFSIDSVITAVGLADHLIIMIFAVMIAVVMMMVFIDPISNFINAHPEMKILALCFIVVIGFLLVLDGLGINSGIEVLEMHVEKFMIYFAMVFAFILELIQMRYNKNSADWRKERWKADTAAQIDNIRTEMLKQLDAEKKKAESGAPPVAGGKPAATNFTPVFIGSNVYIMMPVSDEDVSSFKGYLEASPEFQKSFEAPIELTGEDVVVEDVDSVDNDKEDNNESSGSEGTS